jgi:hypothetical protein
VKILPIVENRGAGINFTKNIRPTHGSIVNNPSDDMNYFDYGIRKYTKNYELFYK